MIKILHFKNKEEYLNSEISIADVDLISFTTKKNKVKILKNNYGCIGKIEKIEYKKMIIEILEDKI